MGCGQEAGSQGARPSGLIRASFGLYNSLADVDALVAGLTAIAQGAYRGVYGPDGHGGFEPVP